MSCFDKRLAENAAAMIPGLNADEREAVVIRLGEIATMYHATDMTKADARERLEDVLANLRQAQKGMGHLMAGWSEKIGTPTDIQVLGFEMTRLPVLIEAAETALEKVKAAPQKQKGGLMAQHLHDSKEGWAISRISELWFFTTFDVASPTSGPGRDFISKAYVAVVGDEEETGAEARIKRASRRYRLLRGRAIEHPNNLSRYLQHYFKQVQKLLNGEFTEHDAFWADGVVCKRLVELAYEHHEAAVRMGV
jgi:hypothetical protein